MKNQKSATKATGVKRVIADATKMATSANVNSGVILQLCSAISKKISPITA